MKVARVWLRVQHVDRSVSMVVPDGWTEEDVRRYVEESLELRVTIDDGRPEKNPFEEGVDIPE